MNWQLLLLFKLLLGSGELHLKHRSYLLCGFTDWFLTRLCLYMLAHASPVHSQPTMEVGIAVEDAFTETSQNLDCNKLQRLDSVQFSSK